MIEFVKAVGAVLRGFNINSMEPEVSLSGLDSLAVTEICVLAEEHLQISLAFDEVRKMKTVADLIERINA